MADRLRLQIITPAGLVCDSACSAVRVPVPDGYMGILPGHAPLVGVAAEGIVTYTAGGLTCYAAVSRGAIHVSANEVLVLSDAAETAENADLARAALERVRTENK